jgi:beta-galactosidase
MSPEAALAGNHDWQPVSLPHDWSVEHDYDQHSPTGGTGGYVIAGIG